MVRFSEQQIAWREDNLGDVPNCSETLIIRWLLLQVNGDFVTRAALELAGVPDDGNPYLQLPSDEKRIQEVADSMSDEDLLRTRLK